MNKLQYFLFSNLLSKFEVSNEKSFVNFKIKHFNKSKIMKGTKKITTLGLAFAMAFSACNKDEPQLKENPTEIKAISGNSAARVENNSLTLSNFSATSSYSSDWRNLQFTNRVYRLANVTQPVGNNGGAGVITGEFWADYTNVNNCGRASRHYGLDTRAASNTPIYSPISGVVIRSLSSFGQLAIYNQEKHLTLIFVHLLSRNVSENSNVVVGQLIGYSGGTGSGGLQVFTPHLHTELLAGRVREASNDPCRPTNTPYDPRLIVDLFPSVEITNGINQSRVSSSNLVSGSRLEEGNRLVINYAHRYNHIAGQARIELSDAFGNFAATPNGNTVLASTNFSANASFGSSQQITANIPSNLTTSNNYKIRVAFRPTNNVPPVFSTLDNINIFSNISISRTNRTLTTTLVSGATYQWFRNGLSIAGATAQTYTVPVNITGFNRYECRVSRNGLTKIVALSF